MERQCFVPSCPNTTGNSPDKLFVKITERLAEEWCKLVNAPYYKNYSLYCCEDHLSRDDISNYFRSKLMKEVPKLAPNAKLRNIQYIPVETTSSTLRNILVDFQHTAATPSKRKYDEILFPSASGSTLPLKVERSTQCAVSTVDKGVYTIQRMTFHMDEETESGKESAASWSLWLPETETTSGTSLKEKQIEKGFNKRKHLLNLIYNKPKMYLGLPKKYLWIIDIIASKSADKTSKLSILITMFKMKHNDPLERLSDEFELSRPTVSKHIYHGVQILANYFQNFIFLPSPLQIKMNLPLVFKLRYSDVQMIIDCFEIQIEKPSDPLKQAQTWSTYKNCNTVKYLIGCTPSGFVNFISQGYGGRISDKALVNESLLIDYLPTNAVIMADRGFKEVESALASKNIKLLRPPSVYANQKPTKEEVLKSKTIASLRIHVERVIRRIREFKILKPHSVVHHKYVTVLDNIVIIACGLINLQNEIIKKKKIKEE